VGEILQRERFRANVCDSAPAADREIIKTHQHFIPSNRGKGHPAHRERSPKLSQKNICHPLRDCAAAAGISITII